MWYIYYLMAFPALAMLDVFIFAMRKAVNKKRYPKLKDDGSDALAAIIFMALIFILVI